MIVRTALSVIPLGRGHFELGALHTNIDDDEVLEFINGRLAWSQFYSDSDDLRL
jgi:hypothetical protein